MTFAPAFIANGAVPPAPELNLHPNLRFVVVRVSFEDNTPAPKRKDAHLTEAQKQAILERWTPLVGRTFPHTHQFQEGVHFRQAWIGDSPYTIGGRLQERYHINQCPRCCRYADVVDNRRTT